IRTAKHVIHRTGIFVGGAKGLRRPRVDFRELALVELFPGAIQFRGVRGPAGEVYVLLERRVSQRKTSQEFRRCVGRRVDCKGAAAQQQTTKCYEKFGSHRQKGEALGGNAVSDDGTHLRVASMRSPRSL